MLNSNMFKVSITIISWIGFHHIYITESFCFHSQDLCFPLTHTPLGKFAFSLQTFLPLFGALGRSWSFFPRSLTHIKAVRLRADRRRERTEEEMKRGNVLQISSVGCISVSTFTLMLRNGTPPPRSTPSYSSTAEHTSAHTPCTHTHTHNIYQNVAA